MASITTQTGTLGGGLCAPHSPGWARPQPACAAEQLPGCHRAVGALPGELGAKAMFRPAPRGTNGAECEGSWPWCGARQSRGPGTNLQAWTPFLGCTNPLPGPGSARQPSATPRKSSAWDEWPRPKAPLIPTHTGLSGPHRRPGARAVWGGGLITTWAALLRPTPWHL